MMNEEPPDLPPTPGIGGTALWLRRRKIPGAIPRSLGLAPRQTHIRPHGARTLVD